MAAKQYSLYCRYRRLKRGAIATASSAAKGLLRVLYRRQLGRGGLRKRQPFDLGFVLPTTAMLLVVVSLSVGAMVLRAYDQTVQAGGDRQQQAVVNAASPAVDRAKAKLDYLFDRRTDPRLPAGVPHQDQLRRLLLNRSEPVLTLGEGDNTDPYTFPDETRLDVDGDGALDNAWRYRMATSSGANATVAYSILLHQPGAETSSVAQRAAQGAVRQAPSGHQTEGCRSRHAELAAAYADAGWTADLAHPSRYRKNIQVDVYVLPDRAGQPVATLELQQERQVQQGFPWAAWFQDDLELSSEEPLVLNGAFHTEGSLIMSDDTVALLPASAPASCLSGPGAARLTTGHAGSAGHYEGYGIAGSLERDRFGGSTRLYDQSGSTLELSTSTDTLGHAPQRLSDLLLDPLTQLMEGRQGYRSPEVTRQGSDRSASPDAQGVGDRLYAKGEDLPPARDRFRADDRYGPEATVGGRLIPGKIGEPIDGDRLLNGPAPLSDERLTRNAPANTGVDEKEVGLDGYWERRARLEGLRIIVGQRLELQSPLSPGSHCPSNAHRRCHEARQRRSLRDALAAVQATLLYPAQDPDPDRPVACLLSVVHPGTAATLAASSAFSDRSMLLRDYLPTGFYTGKPIVTDLFSGQGTNGWEYAALPAAVETEADFERAIAAPAPLGKALRNLAHFAGDPLGGSPSFTPPSDGAAQVHPYPLLAAWGDFSLLRRILEGLDRSRASYRQLSPADKATLHSAACSLGVLAYNVGYLTQFTYPDPAAMPVAMEQLIAALHEADASAFDSPQAVLAALRRRDAPLSPDVITLAETIALKAQVQRDRRWGFALGTVNGPEVLDPALQALSPREPAFPALQYLFPPLGGAVEDSPTSGSPAPGSPWRDDYIAQLNQGWRYQAIDVGDEATLKAIAVAPRPLAHWRLPHQPAPPGPSLSDRALYLTCQGAVCGGAAGRVRLAIKEAALFDGREMLMARVLDLDLDQLRSSPVLGHSWLPDSGIVYGFREDAVREDAINRPAQQPWSACGQYRALVAPAGGCATNAVFAAGSSHDPPLGDRAISPKPIDGLSDPDRRPYGFRLRNGARLSRESSPPAFQARGLSFVTDNPVYVMGPFNLHQAAGCRGNCPLEEFRELLPAQRPYRPREFYRRHTRDPRFADPQQDDWRASEIVADSVTVLSEQFCDGSVEDTWATAGMAQPRLSRDTMTAYGCRNRDRRTSFLNQNRPRSRPPTPGDTTSPWQRAIPSDPSSPIVISPQGNPVLKDGADYAGAYSQFSHPKALIRARPQTVNALVVSGGAPSRKHQSSGGLLGQLRRLEHWESLTFNGAWVQLGVSRYATAPLDQDAWEPRSRPQRAKYSQYQALEQPHWRYDVGLQYVSAPPFARQFETVAANPRSELYSTPAANDPYLLLLCRAATDRCR